MKGGKKGKKKKNNVCGEDQPVLGGTELMAHREHIHVFKRCFIAYKRK